ncbi:hypothetical protein SDC9_174803 [bioreactor metagenome]|uniref:HutD-family protein n=1 Tax=bioreactor metagenome TaxID=1076179 RepID=A0A645GNA5_9ZZZZ|nr:HutD family protein [Romboutsia lituseburensis]
MTYDINVIRKNEHKTSSWSGGYTTQLYIYPESSIYSDLNFIFRVSSAKVSVNESTFTSLPGINRKIMILDGTLNLKHEGHHEIKLNKFQQDSFKGEWLTKSYGKVTDFNLMMSKGCDGNLEHIKIDCKTLKKLNLSTDIDNNKEMIIIFYCLDGSVDINMDSLINLNEGDLLVLKNNKKRLYNINILNNFEKEANIIKVTTCFDKTLF